MNQKLNHIKVAILVADGFEQIELTQPQTALQEAGARTEIVSPVKGKVEGWHHFDKADKFAVDVAVEDANAMDYDLLLLPGGVANPDQLRINENAVRFVKEFFEQNKFVAVICHAAWTLIESNVVRGRKMTAWKSLKTDLLNAGAEWRDEAVVIDGRLISSRNPEDLFLFSREIIVQLEKAASHN